MINCYYDGALYDTFSVPTVHRGRHWTFYEICLYFSGYTWRYYTLSIL